MTWTRRKFIKAGILTALAYAFADAFWIEKFFIETKEYYIGNANSQKHSLKLLQISDLHIQSLGYKLKKLADKINFIKPDLILITGDAVDNPTKLNILNEFLQLIDHDIKKAAILGNWEYWGNVSLVNLASIYVDNNCKLLINNTNQYIIRDKSITITGLDDYVGGRADIERALIGFQSSDYHVILNHCPEYADIIAQKLPKTIKTDFILSGHTHGGQINLFGLVLFKPRGSGKYLKGWYRDDAKNLYVSKGIGTSILPIRFMARAEIAVFYI